MINENDIENDKINYINGKALYIYKLNYESKTCNAFPSFLDGIQSNLLSNNNTNLLNKLNSSLNTEETYYSLKSYKLPKCSKLQNALITSTNYLQTLKKISSEKSNSNNNKLSKKKTTEVQK